jgi:hypothetical protein
MTPSHSNKDGVRDRYYVSHTAVKTDVGGVVRVPAIQLERLAVDAIRAKASPRTEPKGGLSDREVIDRCVTRITVRPDSIDIELREPTAASAHPLATAALVTAGAISPPWTVQAFPSVRGFLHQPDAKPTSNRRPRGTGPSDQPTLTNVTTLGVAKDLTFLLAARTAPAMREPGFWWQGDGATARLLAPAGTAYGLVAARRMAQPGARAAVARNNNDGGACATCSHCGSTWCSTI